jgi:16S rRNA (cytosine967-C5)-methyltransferase
LLRRAGRQDGDSGGAQSEGSYLLACDVSRRRLDEMRGLLRNVRGARISYETCDAAKLAYDKTSISSCAMCHAAARGRLRAIRRFGIVWSRRSLPASTRARWRFCWRRMRALKPGGRLVYASCSLEPEENESVIQDCLSGRPEFREAGLESQLSALVDEGSLAAGCAESLLEKGRLRTLPGVYPCDGFFAAMIERVS